MKDQPDRTKVVLRHLPPAVSQAALMEQIDARFAGRYQWASFRLGKNSQKNQRFSRAYISFKRTEDILEFAEFFNGHLFVNEKGAQFKALVEYAPSQRVPKPCSKKNGREGTILKDPEYLEFLELISKPVENLPSAEIQLERREAERSGAAKETPIVTPLMEFVRQKRAAKSGSQRSSGNGKVSRKLGLGSANSSSPFRRGPEKQRKPASMYVVRDSTRNGRGKDKLTYILAQRREEQRPTDNSVLLAPSRGIDIIQNKTDGTISEASEPVQTGNRRLLLSNGKGREGSPASGVLSQQRNITSSSRNPLGTTPFRQNRRHETGGTIIRTILSNKDGHHSRSFTVATLSEQPMQATILEKDRGLPQPPTTHSISRDDVSGSPSFASVSDGDCKSYGRDKISLNDQHGASSIIEKNDKHIRNKDRPDRGVWTTLRHSDRSRASEETPSAQMSSDVVGVDEIGVGKAYVGRGLISLGSYDMQSGRGHVKSGIPTAVSSAENKSLEGGRVSLSAVENGSHKHVRRRPIRGFKEVDNSLSLSEGKSSKRGPNGYGSHERQVWIQKPASAS